MCDTVSNRMKRHCLPLTYAFSPSHIKSVLVGMVTEYESKFARSHFNRRYISLSDF